MAVMVPVLTAMGMGAGTAATVATVGTYAAAAATVIGGMEHASSMRSAAAANKNQADYKAGQEAAAGQYKAEASRKRADLMLSRAHAVAAASGGGALDQTLATGILDQGERAAGFDMYGSTEAAKGTMYAGDVGVSSANARANSTLLGSFVSGANMGFSQFSPGAAPGSRSPAEMNNVFGRR
jgi:hypothetical protein